MQDILYQVTTDKSFDAAVAAVEAQTQAIGFRVMHIHDVQATLAEKGFVREPIKILEICNSKYADMALKIDVTVSLLMPCRINVYVENGVTTICAIRPKVQVAMYQEPKLDQFAAEIDAAVQKVVEASI